MWYIYALQIEETGEYFYVGKTKNIRQRFDDHRFHALHNDHVYPIFSSLFRGFYITIHVLEVCEHDLKSTELENEWWFKLKQDNHPIVNRRPWATWTKHAGMAGRKHSSETKRKMSSTKIGKHHTIAARRKMSESQKNRPKISDITRQKISDAGTGRPSPNKGKQLSDEVRAKMSASHKGKKQTEEHKAAIREAKRLKRQAKTVQQNSINNCLKDKEVT